MPMLYVCNYTQKPGPKIFENVKVSSLMGLEATPDVNTVGYSIRHHMDTVAAFVDFMRHTVAHWFDPATRTDL